MDNELAVERREIDFTVQPLSTVCHSGRPFTHNSPDIVFGEIGQIAHAGAGELEEETVSYFFILSGVVLTKNVHLYGRRMNGKATGYRIFGIRAEMRMSEGSKATAKTHIIHHNA
jgi:hypothetical protein